MIWINLKMMEQRLSDGNVAEGEVINYFIGSFVITILIISTLVLDFHDDAIMIGAVISSIISTIGIRLLYKIQQETKSLEFFKCFFSLFFVLGVRFIIFVALVEISLVIISSIFRIGFDRMTMMVVSNMLYGYFFFLMQKSFRRIHSNI